MIVLFRIVITRAYVDTLHTRSKQCLYTPLLIVNYQIVLFDAFREFIRNEFYNLAQGFVCLRFGYHVTVGAKSGQCFHYLWIKRTTTRFGNVLRAALRNHFSSFIVGPSTTG